MTEPRHFLEVGRDDDDAEAGVEGMVEQAVDLGLGADVDAGGRSSATSRLPPMRSQRPTTTFC